MHVWFRQYAQQMGMQNVRAILPEQIDLLINTSITDFVNELIKTNIGITNDRVITDNSKIGQINAFSTLYKVAFINMSPDTTGGQVARPFTFTASSRKTGKMQGSKVENKTANNIPDALYIIDFSLNYKKVKDNKGYNGQAGSTYVVPTFEEDGIETNFFPVRLIDDAFLADTLNDFVLKNRLRSPIIVNYNNGFDLYIDEFKKVITVDGNETRYVLENGLLPYQLRMSYLAKPAKVAYKEDLTGNSEDNVNCDLPEYTHVDVLKHAVDLYRIAISGSLHAAQQQEQNAQQENMRNNYRNEGNQ